jgi:protein SCO1/2
MHRPRGPIIGALALLVAIAGIIVLHQRPAQAVDRAFQLVDSKTGQQVSDQTFRGKWLLIFFGYSYCPDVCPTTLSDIAETMSELGPLSAKVQPLFVTVDPARDTAKVLADYTSAFDPRILGLTGTPAQITAAARTYHATYARRGLGDDYSVDHTATVYVVRPDGAYDSNFLPFSGPASMTERLRRLID